MNVFKILLSSAIGLVKMFRSKPSVTDVIIELVGMVPRVIQNVGVFGDLSTKEKLDQALETFDAYTGSDPGALDLIRDLPADKEEEVMDAIKIIIRNVGYCTLKVDGYSEK